MSLAESISHDTANDDRIAIWTSADRTTWAEFHQLYRDACQTLVPFAGRRVGLPLTADASGLARLAACDHVAADVFLFDAQMPTTRQLAWATQLGLHVLLATDDRSPIEIAAGDDATSDEAGGTVTILTSGTTGQPKAVRHTWDSLSRPVRRIANGASQHWLLAFRPHLYAGLQVTLQALLNRGRLVVGPAELPPAEVVDLMAAAEVQYASATPSYWRRLLMVVSADALQRIPLVQITLGGEVADQATLDRLARLYPQARLAHIYATTEMGRCFSVTDGQAGFPAQFLDQPTPDGVELKAVDGELWVRSTNAMKGYDAAASDDDLRDQQQGWFATRDRIEQRGDRVFFVGRTSDMINVGGNKVYPVAVERVIRQLDEVADVRIYGVESSVAGQLVACQAVAARGVDPDQARKKILEHCQRHLDRFQCPRIIDMRDELPLNDAGKVER